MTDAVVAAVGETSVEVVLPAAQAVCSCPAPVGRGSLGWMPFAARGRSRVRASAWPDRLDTLLDEIGSAGLHVELHVDGKPVPLSPVARHSRISAVQAKINNDRHRRQLVEGRC